MTDPAILTDPAFDRDKFLLRQKHFAINQKYYIQDEKGRNILFVERPIFFMQSCLSLKTTSQSPYCRHLSPFFLRGTNAQ